MLDFDKYRHDTSPDVAAYKCERCGMKIKKGREIFKTDHFSNNAHVYCSHACANKT